MGGNSTGRRREGIKEEKEEKVVGDIEVKDPERITSAPFM